MLALSAINPNDNVVNGAIKPELKKALIFEKNMAVHRGNLVNIKAVNQRTYHSTGNLQEKPKLLNLRAVKHVSSTSPPHTQDLDSLILKRIEQLQATQAKKKTIDTANSETQKLLDFSKDVKSWEINYFEWMNSLEEYSRLQRKVLEFFKYFYINRENLVTAIRRFLSEDQYDCIETQLDRSRETSKILSPVAHLFFNAVKWCMIGLAHRDLKELEVKWWALKSGMSALDRQDTVNAAELKSIQEQMDNLKKKLDQDQKSAQDQGYQYLVKLSVKFSVIPITEVLIRWKTLQELAGEKIQEVAHKIGSRGSKHTACIFKYLFQIRRIHLALCLQSKWIQELKPPVVEISPDVLASAHIQALLQKRQLEFEDHVNKNLSEIDNHIEQCQGLTFDETKQYFAKLSIHLDDLQDPPQDEDDWAEKIQLEEFHIALSTEWVKHQETVAKLQEQVFRQALLSKNLMERSLLNFRCLENIASIISSLIQIVVVIPFSTATVEMMPFLKKLVLFLKKLVTDLTKDQLPFTNIRIPYLGLTYLIFPEINLRILDLFAIFIFEYVVGVSYKPHEYSFEGYQLSIQIKLWHIYSLIYALVAWSKQALVWLNVQLVENCVMRLDHKPSQDPRIIEIYEQSKEQHINCKQLIKDLEDRLDQLRLKDTRTTAFSQKEDQLDSADTDPFKILAETAQDLNWDYIPESTRQFFEMHLGIQSIKVASDKLKKSLEDVFLVTEEDFIESYSERRSKIPKI